MAPACARAGLRRIGPHKLRHRYVSRRIVARSDALSRSDAERLAQHALDLEPLPARGWDARLEPPAELGYELGHGPDPHYRDYVRDGPGLER